jgi:hypothetical protein
MGASAKRSTVYLDAALHRVLRIKAAETDRSISELVNEAVKQSFLEDAEDLAAFKDRARERTVSFEKVLREMRRRGKL